MNLRITPPRPQRMSANEEWASARSAAAAEHQARLEARQESERRQAQHLIDAFTAAAAREGLPPEPLRVQGYRASVSARTPLRGWYLRKDRKAGIDTDGRYYLLVLPLTFTERISGVTPAPAPPPLVLGAGGRDGDSVTLAAALERLLPGWSRGRINPCQE